VLQGAVVTAANRTKGGAARCPQRDFLERRMEKNKDGRIVETAVEARGARLGRPVLVVLVVSTLAVIGIFALVFYGHFG
jgi:hypothetical protein